MKNDEKVEITPEVINPEVITPEVVKPVEVKPEEIKPDYKDLYTRSLADYDNMKKRYEKQISDSVRSSLCDVVKTIISPIYNDLKRGVKNGVSGCDLILKNLDRNLEKEHIKVVGEDVIGKTFNTDYMEAVSSIQTDDESKRGKVVDVLECGFIDEHNDKTCVYSKVIVFN